MDTGCLNVGGFRVQRQTVQSGYMDTGTREFEVDMDFWI